MVRDRQELSRLWFELHAQHLARYHRWSIGRARSVIEQCMRDGAHGFWEVDPVEYWSAKRD